MTNRSRASGRRIPRWLKLATWGTLAAAMVSAMAGFGYLGAAAPPKRADALIRAVAAPARDLQRDLDAVSEALARQQGLLSQIPGGASNALAQQMRLNAREGMAAANGALAASAQVAFSVSSFGGSVAIGRVPSLARGESVDIARRHLEPYPEESRAIQGNLREVAALFAYADGMAPVFGEVLAYDPSRDLTLPIQPDDRATVLLRAERTMGALTDTVSQLSTVATPPSLLSQQERLVREFLVAQSLLAQTELDVRAGNLQGANDKAQAYGASIRAAQANLASAATLCRERLDQAMADVRRSDKLAPLVEYLDRAQARPVR